MRRAFRTAAREVGREHKRQAVATLQSLVSSHVPVRTVRFSATGDAIFEFRDGTVLDLTVREGETGLRRLVQRIPPMAYLESVEPCFGHLWFRMHFVAMFDHPYVVARVRHTSDRPQDHGEEAGQAQA